MASSKIFILLLFCLLSATTAIGKAAGFPKEQITHLHFYFHGFFAGAATNPNTFTVASLHRNSSNFGDILVYDSLLTEGPDPTSQLIGRAQGIDVAASLEDGSLLTAQNYVFTAGEYDGSTIALFGRADASAPVAERSIVGGSGQFRLARGYSLAKILEFNASYILLEFDFYVFHY